MSSFIKIIASCLTLGLMIQQAQASSDLLRLFAQCTGRMTAQMEHHWLLDQSQADQVQAQRAVMVDLLDSLMTPGDGPQVLNWRVSARIAHAGLLTRASFNQDAEDATYAHRLATNHVAECTGLLLG